MTPTEVLDTIIRLERDAMDPVNRFQAMIADELRQAGVGDQQIYDALKNANVRYNLWEGR